jgi:hypothetical protein
MLTGRQFRAMPPLLRWGYRLLRNPIVLFGLAPFWVFVIQQRLISRCAPGLEDLNDDHPAAAAGTRMRKCLRLTIAGAVDVSGRSLWRR